MTTAVSMNIHPLFRNVKDNIANPHRFSHSHGVSCLTSYVSFHTIQLRCSNVMHIVTFRFLVYVKTYIFFSFLHCTKSVGDFNLYSLIFLVIIKYLINKIRVTIVSNFITAWKWSNRLIHYILVVRHLWPGCNIT